MARTTFEELCERLDYQPKRRLLSTDEAAEVLGFRRNTLEQHRLRGSGPPFFSPPGTRRVFYVERDLLEWLVAGEKTSTSQTP
jgi:hypothetical protein